MPVNLDFLANNHPHIKKDLTRTLHPGNVSANIHTKSAFEQIWMRITTAAGLGQWTGVHGIQLFIHTIEICTHRLIVVVTKIKSSHYLTLDTTIFSV